MAEKKLKKGIWIDQGFSFIPTQEDILTANIYYLMGIDFLAKKYKNVKEIQLLTTVKILEK